MGRRHRYPVNTWSIPLDQTVSFRKGAGSSCLLPQVSSALERASKSLFKQHHCPCSSKSSILYSVSFLMECGFQIREWWCRFIITANTQLIQDNHELKISLCFVVKASLSYMGKTTCFKRSKPKKQWIRITLLAAPLMKQLTPLLATTFINNWLSNHCFWWHFLIPALALSHLFPLNRNIVEIKELKTGLPLPLSSCTSIYTHSAFLLYSCSLWH